MSAFLARRSVRNTAAALALVLGMAATAAAPATAANDPLRGKGKAIVRIDAAQATATELGEDRYRITLPTGSRGQWLGERILANGKEKTLVGSLAATDLAKRWADLGHRPRAKVDSTITWSAEDPATAMAHGVLSRPQKDDAGRVSFEFVTTSELPSTLTDATINISRASGPMTRSFPVSKFYMLTQVLSIRSYVQGPQGMATESFQSGNGLTCYTLTLSQAMAVGMTPPNLLCGSATVNGTLRMIISDSAGVQPGSVSFQGTVQPSGQPSMSYTATVATWGPTG